MTEKFAEKIRLSPLTRIYEEKIRFVVSEIRNLNVSFLESIASLGESTKTDLSALHCLGIDTEIKKFFDNIEYSEFKKLAVSYCLLAKYDFSSEKISGFAKAKRLGKTLRINNDATQKFLVAYLHSLKNCAKTHRSITKFAFRLSDTEIDELLSASDADIHFYSLIVEPKFHFIFSLNEIVNFFDDKLKLNEWNYALHINHKLGEIHKDKVFFNNTITSRVLGDLLTTNILHKALPAIEEQLDNAAFALLVDLDVRPSYAAYLLQDNMVQSGWIRDVQNLGIVNPSEIEKFSFKTLDQTQQFTFTAFVLMLLGISEFKDTEVRLVHNFAASYLFFRYSFQRDFEQIYIDRSMEIKMILEENSQEIKYSDLEDMLTASASSLFKLTVRIFGGHIKTRRTGSAFLYAEFSRSGVDNYGTSRIRDNRQSLWVLAQCPDCGALYLAALDVYSGKRCPFCGSAAIVSQTRQRTAYAPLRLREVHAVQTATPLYSSDSE